MKGIIFVAIIWLISINFTLPDMGDYFLATDNDWNPDISNPKDTLENNCMECHESIIQHEEVHGPVKKGCDRCHKANGNEHPMENVKGFTLPKEIPGLCFDCHGEIDDMERIHEPAKEGKCLECHMVHSSPNIYLTSEAPTSKLCEKCHTLKMSKDTMIHQPVADGACNDCHDPHQANNKQFLKKEEPKSCIRCHRPFRKIAKLENVHPPFKDECSMCHEAHSSKSAHLSDQNVYDMCIQCHDDIMTAMVESPSVHDAIRDGESCINCHTPHATDEKHLLLSTGIDLCFNCHDKEIMMENRTLSNIKQLWEEGKSVHGAIAEGGCDVCHKPHASEIHTLLTEAFPEGEYAPAEKDYFAICFQCHESNMMEEQFTLTATNFRHGKQNLHYLHINGNKGRNCTMCHNNHGSFNDHLIEETVPFGNWDMPIKFVHNENGGSCSPGCHGEKSYERTLINR